MDQAEAIVARVITAQHAVVAVVERLHEQAVIVVTAQDVGSATAGKSLDRVEAVQNG